MSVDISATNEHGSGYQVESLCGCRIVRGSVPLLEFAAIAKQMPKDARLDVQLAQRIGATFVIGTPGDLAKLRALGLPPSVVRQAEVADATAKAVPAAVVDWLRDGERGSSSECMCKTLFGVPASAGTDHPHDPGDLRRCVLFLEAADAMGRIAEMRAVSAEWAGIVSRWPEIEAAFQKERNQDSAPDTYALLRVAVGA
ncbi:MAG: hypothetical protein KJZ92_14020 [Rhodocyclaceae bacterium]|nr:hypothetical protein [Rhodocyclaceae bacterium]